MNSPAFKNFYSRQCKYNIGLVYCNWLCTIYNSKLVNVRNSVYRFLVHGVERVSLKSWIGIKNHPNPRSPRLFTITQEFLHYELGPLSNEIRDVKQTTIARLPENVLLSGLAAVSRILPRVPQNALLPTFIGICRLARLYGIRFYLDYGVGLCLTCLRHECHCRRYTFDTIEVQHCSCDGLICSCDDFPAAPLILDEIDRMNKLVFGETLELITLSADDFWGRETLDDLLGPSNLVINHRRTKFMLIQPVVKSDLRPP